MALITGTNGSDVLNGTSGNDTFIGDPHVGGGNIGSVSVTVANGDSAIYSPDGKKLFFRSSSSTLVSGDTNNTADIFVKDLASGSVTRVSTDSSGGQLAGFSTFPKVSPDGNHAMFTVFASALAQQEGRAPLGVYVKDLSTGNLTRLPDLGVIGFSPDGSKVLFQSNLSNLVAGDTNGVNDLFTQDVATGVITRVSTNSLGVQLTSGVFNAGPFSPDGTKVLFSMFDGNAVPGDNNGANDLFMKDLRTGTVTLLSSGPTGAPTSGSTFFGELSKDNSKVLFYSAANNLVAGDTNGAADYFVKDLRTNEITAVNTAPNGSLAFGNLLGASFSPDNTKVIFKSDSSGLVPGFADTNGTYDIFVKDLVTGAVTWVSTGADAMSFDYAFSPDGTKVAFTSAATNLGGGSSNGRVDVFVKDLATGIITLVSRDVDGTELALGASGFKFSPDGTGITFAAGDGRLMTYSFPATASGADTFNGGAGVDTVSYDTALAAVTVNLLDVSGNSNTGDAFGDIYNSIERFRLSNFNDTFIGSSAATAVNIAFGGDGNDLFKARGTSTNTFFGEGGNDTFKAADGVITAYGGAGNDTFNGWSMVDTFHGGDGDDIAFGGGNHDILNGNDGNDYINGEKSDDIINGGAGDDTLIGLWDQDRIFGGTGQDTLTGDHGNDMLSGQDGNDSLDGGIGVDKLYGGNGEDLLVGGDQNDLLSGGNGNDSLVGGNDTDTLIGGAGNDVLRGGLGNDRLTGGAGADTFRFGEVTSGADRITDFEDGVDLISMTLSLADHLSDLVITGNGTTTVTVAVGGQSIVVHGASAITLTEGDFVFG
jgi:trimeric autotransporter adhesin